MKIKTFKKVVSMAMALSVVFCASGCIDPFRMDLYDEGYYIYTKLTDPTTACIVGLTDLGKEQEYLVIPEYINGLKIEGIGCYLGLQDEEIAEKYGSTSYADFKSEKLKKVYVLFDVEINTIGFSTLVSCFEEAPSFEGVFCSGVQHFRGRFRVYSPVGLFGGVLGGGYDFNGIVEMEYINSPANVTYYYNYENAPQNGCYWIDDYDGNTIEFIPENPIREGYVFGGWFKEPECENVWDFDKDMVPKKEYYEESDYLLRYPYIETSLYAKWYKK